MSDRNKNKRSLLADFIRYQQDQLSGKERNSFERELQRDDFAREAAEGFSLVSEEQTEKDLKDLQNRLNKRTERRQRIFIYRIAASIAILMMISTLFLFIGKNKSGEKLADTSIQPNEFKVTKNLPLTEPLPGNRPEAQPAKSLKKSDKTASIQSEMKTSAGISRAARPVMALHPSNDSIPVVKSEPASIYVSDEKRMIPATIKAKDRSKEFTPKADTNVEGKLDPSVASLSEVVVTGYGSKKYDSSYDETAPGHTPPQPIGGKQEYDKYIKENLHRPDTLSMGQRAVVVVSFLVRKDGKIDSIRIIRSPGRPFSDEAIRVLKSGPSWKPALDGDAKVDEEVRLRVVFK
jgi:TonB family protein